MANAARRSAVFALMAVGSTLPPIGASGQTAGPLAADAVRTVVEDVATLLEARYVFPDVGARYATAIRAEVRGYGALTPSELAARVTADLRRVNPDLHLTLTLAPESAGAGGAQVRIGAEADVPPVAATAAELFSPIQLDGLPEIARSLFADEARRNHFFSKLEILPGNIGYLAYDQFGFPNFSTEAADAAFAFLDETRAIIIDLRHNRGGIEGMNQYLASHFFGSEPVHLYSRYYGTTRTTVAYTTFPDHVARRFPDRPLYILVSRGTASAAENFSFALQGLGRAVVVGERTAGAAHSSQAFPVSHGFLLQLPVARAFNPRTDADWEGRGVQPDLEADPDSALAVAHGHAVETIAEDADPAERLDLEDARLLLAARGSAPVGVDPDDYVGDYGHRRVFLEGGKLRMVRTDIEGIAAVDLVALAADYFTLEQVGTARVRFERDGGRVVRIQVRLPTGAWESADRR